MSFDAGAAVGAGLIAGAVMSVLLYTGIAMMPRPVQVFRLAWDVACSAFGSRQVLYERSSAIRTEWQVRSIIFTIRTGSWSESANSCGEGTSARFLRGWLGSACTLVTFL